MLRTVIKQGRIPAAHADDHDENKMRYVIKSKLSI